MEGGWDSRAREGFNPYPHGREIVRPASDGEKEQGGILKKPGKALRLGNAEHPLIPERV